MIWCSIPVWDNMITVTHTLKCTPSLCLVSCVSRSIISFITLVFLLHVTHSTFSLPVFFSHSRLLISFCLVPPSKSSLLWVFFPPHLSLISLPDSLSSTSVPPSLHLANLNTSTSSFLPLSLPSSSAEATT